MTIKGPLGSPIPPGKTFPVLKGSPTSAGSADYKFGIDADGILVSVFVPLVTGAVNVIVDTLGDDGSERRVITFPSITSPTAELVFKTAVNILSTIRVTVTYTGSCEYQIRARGIGRGGAAADDVPLNIDVDVSALTVLNPQIQNILLTTAGDELAVVLPIGTKRFKFQAVNDSLLKYSYLLGQSNSVYITVWPGNSEEETNINALAALTLYVNSNKDNTPVQLLAWT